jgi:hypothetical protein
MERRVYIDIAITKEKIERGRSIIKGQTYPKKKAEYT